MVSVCICYLIFPNIHVLSEVYRFLILGALIYCSSGSVEKSLGLLSISFILHLNDSVLNFSQDAHTIVIAYCCGLIGFDRVDRVDRVCCATCLAASYEEEFPPVSFIRDLLFSRVTVKLYCVYNLFQKALCRAGKQS